MTRKQYNPIGKVGKKEAGEILGVSPQTVKNYERYGWLTSCQYEHCGLKCWYDKAEVEKLKSFIKTVSK